VVRPRPRLPPDRPGHLYGVTTAALAPRATNAAPRLLSLDVVRGTAVVGMLLVNSAGVDGAMPAQLVHAEPGALTVADLVFPLVLLVVGVGTSLSPRLVDGRAVLRRCALLFAIGCLLVSAKYRSLSPSTGVLQHIALATLSAYGVLRLPRRWQAAAWGAALLAAWAAPTWLSLPGTVAGSWDPQTTLASAVERLLTGHVGREQVVASLLSGLTVLAGVFAGRALREHPGLPGAARVAGGGLVAGAAGLLLAGAVPVDKALWTPSYVLVTAAPCALLLVAAVVLLDLPGSRPAARALVQPLRVLGANALAVYVAMTLLYAAVLPPVRDELVAPLRALLGDPAAALLYACSAVLLGWALAAALWRRSVLVRL